MAKKKRKGNERKRKERDVEVTTPNIGILNVEFSSPQNIEYWPAFGKRVGTPNGNRIHVLDIETF
jgi:hypothetical protein